VEPHDSLTGVPHLYVLKANCETELVAQRARGVYRGMFMVINVDNAAAMNYRFGWRHVDDLLQKLARTIEAGLGDAAIGRAGGDGFLVFAKSEAQATSLASSVGLRWKTTPWQIACWFGRRTVQRSLMAFLWARRPSVSPGSFPNDVLSRTSTMPRSRRYTSASSKDATG
jgi:GGDEF domain-containing protein